MDKQYIVTFINTHEAMKAETEAEKIKLKITVIPTPTYITKSCGISLRLGEECIGKFNSLVDEGKVNIKNIYSKLGQEVEVIK